jgi:ABC-type sugar transport system substrate-binding protein
MKRAMIHQIAKLAGVSIGTVDALCRALKDNKMAGHIQLITTDLSPEMAPYFKRGMIRDSIYQDPYLQGKTAVRALAFF